METKCYLIDKESRGPWSAVGFGQVLLDKILSEVSGEALLRYPGHAVLLHFSAIIRQNLIFIGHKLVGFPPVEYREDYSIVQVIDELEFSGSSAIIEQAQLVPLVNFMAQETVSKGREKKAKVVSRGYDLLRSAYIRAKMRSSRWPRSVVHAGRW